MQRISVTAVPGRTLDLYHITHPCVWRTPALYVYLLSFSGRSSEGLRKGQHFQINTWHCVLLQ